MENIKEKMQMASFQMIASIGGAKGCYMEAIELSKDNKFEDAYAKIEEGRKMMAEAHHHHFEFVTEEANGVDLPFSLMLMHAEDQLLTTESIELMATEFVSLYEKLNKGDK
ncbi:MAG: PTS lactose/cellobiose transporter subunit IIA [Anaerorhabdus sp.]